MLRHTVFIFGESEKGEYCIPYICNSLSTLANNFGTAPEGTHGIESAIHAITSGIDVIFFRIKEEGFSLEDYEIGLSVLKHRQILGNISAIHMPGVGSKELIEKSLPLCNLYSCMLIIDEVDLIDYLMESGRPPHTMAA